MVECQLKLKWIRGYGMKFEYSLPDLKRLKSLHSLILKEIDENELK